MTLSSQPLPTIGAPNSTEDSKVRGLLAEIQGIINGALDSSNIASASIVNGDLASPVGSAWRNVLRVDSAGGILPATAAGTYGLSSLSAPFTSGSNCTPIPFVYDSAGMAVAGLATQFRLAVLASTNGTASGISFAFDLRSITNLAGGTAQVSATFGAAAVTGTAVTLVTPAAFSVVAGYSSPFSLSDGVAYLPAVTIAGPPAANSLVIPSVTLQARYV